MAVITGSNAAGADCIVVTTPLLDRSAVSLDQAAAEVKPDSVLGRVPCPSAAAFGNDVALEAYTNFAERWRAELTVQSKALTELASKLRSSADCFERTEETNQQAVTKAAPASVLPGPLSGALDKLTTLVR